MSEQQSSYRQVMKATSIFGGIQVFQIIITIVRSKVIALLIGSTGFGIMGLLTSTTGLISSITNFGLGTSAVRNVATTYSNNDMEKVELVASILHKFVLVSGLLGTIVTIVLSPLLSEYTFGNSNYVLSFIFVSISLFFTQLTVEKNVLLQGTRSIKFLAKSGFIGSLFGLVVSLPIYYFFRLNGIVLAIIVSSIISFIVSLYYENKININRVKISFKFAFKEGKDMLYMGLMLSSSLIITQIASYVIRIYIRYEGGLDQVGLYLAGFAIINSYVGMVFTAMATEFYPRLSSVANDLTKSTKVINQQSEITILILAPIMILFISYADFGVKMLYTDQFMGVNKMLQWAALGMLFKGASFPIAHIFLAKGASKLFFLNETIANIYILFFNVVGYKYAGLQGVGLSFLLGYFLYYIQVFVVAKKVYDYKCENSFIYILITQFLISISCLIFTTYGLEPYNYVSKIFFILIVFSISIFLLNKRMNINELLTKIIRR